MDLCSEPHPSITGLTCEAPVGERHHSTHYASHFDYEAKRFLGHEQWPNEDYQPPMPPLDHHGKTMKALEDSRKVHGDRRVGPVSARSFDLDRARSERDDAMGKIAGRDPAWNEAALKALHRVASRTAEFVVDDIWRELGEAEPGDGRVIGPVILTASKRGWIAKTGEHRQSDRVSNHGRPVAVWRSLLYLGPKNP
jgi:hypothetical protein